MEKIIRECTNCKNVILKLQGEKAWEDNKIFIEIDPKLTGYTCGITGVSTLSNVRLSNGKAYCSKCDVLLYSESERKKF